ncbi:MAG: WD40 repeat domain-containing protein, partial [Planctomycetota bacterium]
FAVTFAVQWRSERELRAKAAAAAEVARQKEQLAAEAEAREREARERAERNEKAAIDAAERAREALVRQMVQRGNLAWVSGDLGVARDSYWEAYLDGADKAAAVWALRQYYLDSGDSGSVQLFHQAFGPTALSPDGRLAATCDAPHGVSLRATDTGAAIHWVRTPDAVVAVSVSNDGRFAACGDGWAGVWSKASHAPLVEVQWAGDFEPSWIREIDGGAALLLAGENTIALFDAAEGKLRARGVLHGPRLGEPLLTGDGARLYVPTRAGVEVAPLYGDEALRSSVWRPGAARALAPLDEDRVAALLDDAVVAGPLDAQSADAWTTLVQLSSRYDLLRANDAGSQLVVASRAGRVAAFDQGRELFAWQASSEGLLDIHLEKEAPAVVTLAADGALTRWVAPEHAQERRTIFHRPVARWALSEKAAAVLMATRQGEVFAYAPEIQPAPIAIDLPGLWRAFGAQGADDISLAIDEAGDTALIASGGRVWQRELDRERTRPLRARSARGLPTAAVALAFDGRVGALYQRSEARDRQVIAFVPLEPPNASRTPALPRSAWRPTPFVGSTIREIRFLPHTYTLVVTRSNGAIIILDPPLNASEESLRDRTSPWMELESPAYRIACSRDAEWLAAACDDGFVRVLDVLNVREMGRFAVRGRVDALSFDPRGDVLLVRSDDGDIELRDMQTLERLLTWEFSAGGGSALAAWIGAGDLALTESRGVELIEFDTIDERIRRGESFALARECLRRADEGDLEGAWHSAALLRIVDTDAGAEAQRAVLDRALRRRGRHIPDEWLDSTE